MKYYHSLNYKYSYQYFLNHKNKWDLILITASNKKQQKYYEIQLNRRKIVNYSIVPDENDERSGSGGASLSCIKYIKDQGISKESKVLVIHSGGDSKRIPQFSAVGKLFSPLPHKINGKFATLFDELLIVYSPLCSLINSGVVFASGDVLPLIDYSEIEIKGDACAVSFCEKSENATHHGVFVFNNNHVLINSLQKRTLAQLTENAAAINGKSYIDTGIIYYSNNIIWDLYNLIDTKEKYNQIVNKKVQLSLYVDFVFPLIDKIKLEAYLLETGNLPLNDNILAIRKRIFNVLNKYTMYVSPSNNSRFIHIGTTSQFLDFMEGNSKQIINNNSEIINSILRSNIYIENSLIENSYVGDNSILSYVCMKNIIVPSNTVINVIKQINGKYVARIYGVNDNPKDNKIFDKKIPLPLWDMQLYEECDSSSEAVKSSIRLFNQFIKGSFKTNLTNRVSLKQSFENCDYLFVIEQSNYVENVKSFLRLFKDISSRLDISKLHYDFIFPFTCLEEEWIESNLNKKDIIFKIRYYHKLGLECKNDNYIKKAFNLLQDTMHKSTLNQISFLPNLKCCLEKITLTSPLRINFAGGWTDTPPICFELGGSVLNASIYLNNEEPVRVTIEKLSSESIVFECKDLNAYKEFYDVSELQCANNPNDPFALEKAALIIMGVIPIEGGDLKEILQRIGCGIKISSYVVGVPKGSGLGTSSILSYTVTKALSLFFNLNYDEKILCKKVLLMEQLMTTGGGWQDQVGGAIKGFKLITSNCDFNQDLNIDILNVPNEMKETLNNRLCLIYTGQQRLARNLLRKVIGNYLQNKTETLSSLKAIKRISKQMSHALLNNNYNQFIKLYSSHLKYSCNIYKGSVNRRSNSIINKLKPYCDASMIAGAGGGGFIVSFMKKGITVDNIKRTLKGYKFVKVYTASFID